jgi:hypothetical protein
MRKKHAMHGCGSLRFLHPGAVEAPSKCAQHPCLGSTGDVATSSAGLLRAWTVMPPPLQLEEYERKKGNKHYF